MQPLSYQLAETTCWPACVLSGVRILLKESRLATPVYRIVHSLLQDHGVVYYEECDVKALKKVYRQIKKHTGLTFAPYWGGDVETNLRCLALKGDQVAVCDVGNGRHSILLTGRNGNWLKAFDPYWYPRREPDEGIVRIVRTRLANTEVLQRHLLEDAFQAHREAYKKGEAYPMGHNPKKQVMTVIGRNA